LIIFYAHSCSPPPVVDHRLPGIAIKAQMPRGPEVAGRLIAFMANKPYPLAAAALATLGSPLNPLLAC